MQLSMKASLHWGLRPRRLSRVGCMAHWSSCTGYVGVSPSPRRVYVDMLAPLATWMLSGTLSSLLAQAVAVSSSSRRGAVWPHPCPCA